MSVVNRSSRVTRTIKRCGRRCVLLKDDDEAAAGCSQAPAAAAAAAGAAAMAPGGVHCSCFEVVVEACACLLAVPTDICGVPLRRR